MSAADVEVVREMLEAFNRGEYETSTDLFHDEVVMHQASELPDSGTYVGKDEFLSAMALWLSGFERGFQYVPEELTDCGDRVFVRVLLRGTGRGSGVALEQEIFHVYEVREGRIVRLWVIWTEDEARKLAGLAESARE